MNAVYWFSGTGNGYALARQVGAALAPCEIRGITKETVGDARQETFGRVLLIVPSYAYGMPKLVREFCKKPPFQAEYVALAVTCGTRSGGTLAFLRGILKKHGVRVDYGMEIRSVENFLPLFGEQSAEKIRTRVEEQHAKADVLAAALRDRTSNRIRRFHPIAACVSGVFRMATPFLSQRIKVGKACNRCGICRRVCPADAVAVGETGPRIDRRRCNLCQACLNACPKHALSLWRLHGDCKQYRNPDVAVSELIRRD